MSHQTLEAHTIPIPPQLAGRLKQALGRSGTGCDESAFLQQLHFWTTHAAATGWMIDGVKWIYNSLKSWLEQFPWMSEYGLRKAIANLKKLGLIQTAQHWISSYQRVMFYRIDYERLACFMAEVCDRITPRGVNSDPLDMQTDHTPDTKTTANTSFLKQQTGVVASMNDNLEAATTLGERDKDGITAVEAIAPESGPLSPSGSGNSSNIQRPNFPGLIEAVAQVTTHPTHSLPGSLRRAIAQFPERVKGAIAYLHNQQQRRTIQNPVGYLYQAIVEGWELPRAEPTAVPLGFSQWFDWARGNGWACCFADTARVASMTIEGVHHTLHPERGWLPTAQMMQEYSGNGV